MNFVSPFLGFFAPGAVEVVTSTDAINHVGQRVRICGVVASAALAASSPGSPTFLNLDRPYPNHVFTALIWIETRGLFAKPPEALEGKQVCSTGTITTHQGRAEIIVHDPAQITVREPAQIKVAAPREAGFIIVGGKKYRLYSDGRRELEE